MVGFRNVAIHDYRANIFGNYTVPATFLKGLRIGAGAQFFGPRIIGAPLADPNAYLKDRAVLRNEEMRRVDALPVGAARKA